MELRIDDCGLQIARRVRRATSTAHVKAIALSLAKERAHEFTRVGQSFLDRIEARTMAAIRAEVAAAPSKGVTLR